MDALILHRLHFAFTVTYHYLFPQLTMGLALLIVVLKTIALVHHNERYNEAARFWAKIFAINFLIGVVTGIPMEFQFGTNWAQFARTTGGVIGQPLAMEGVFSFFLESAFLGLFLFGEKRLSPWAHWGSSFMVFLGSWISGLFIIITNAWMQHPVAYSLLPNGSYEVTSLWGLLMNSLALLQYAHNMLSFLIYGTTRAEVKGLDQFPRDQWPSPLPLLFYSYHIMAGLGTYFALLMLGEVFLLWRGKLFEARWALWPLLLSFPLPYIANTAGWMTAEIGRQPWLVYGLIRTSDGYSKNVSAGNT